MFLRHDDKRSIVFSLLFLLFLSPTVFAQPNAEYNGSPDKKNNAIFFSNGLQCKYRDDVQGAIRNFEIALRYMPDDHASMYELSEQYIHTGELEEAFAMIQQAASLDPENKWYQIRLGQFYRNFGQYDDFIDLYENLTKKIPDDPELLSDLIDAYLIIEEYDKALEKLGLLETMVGQNEVLIDQQLNILKTQGNNKKLVTKLQELIQANPENPRYYAMLAQVYSEMGKNKDALKMYEKVEELNPNDPYINISLLEFYENNGNEDKAFEELVSAIRNMNLDLSTKMNVYDYWMNKHQNSANINEQARRCGEAFIEMYPDNRIGYLVLGSYYIVIEDAVRSKVKTKPCATMPSPRCIIIPCSPCSIGMQAWPVPFWASTTMPSPIWRKAGDTPPTNCRWPTSTLSSATSTTKWVRKTKPSPPTNAPYATTPTTPWCSTTSPIISRYATKG